MHTFRLFNGHKDAERRLIFDEKGPQQPQPVVEKAADRPQPAAEAPKPIDAVPQQAAAAQGKAAEQIDKTNEAAIKTIEAKFTLNKNLSNKEQALASVQKEYGNKFDISLDGEKLIVKVKAPPATPAAAPPGAPDAPKKSETSSESVQRLVDSIDNTDLRNDVTKALNLFANDPEGKQIVVDLVSLLEKGGEQKQKEFVSAVAKLRSFKGGKESFNNIVKAIDNPQEVKSNPNSKELMGFVQSLSPGEKEIVKFINSCLEKMTAAAPPEVENKSGIPEADQQKMVKAAENDLKGVDPSKMKPDELDMKIGSAMLKHGVSVAVEDNKFVVEAPQSGWDVLMNKLVGLMTLFGGITGKFNKTLERAKAKTPVETPAQASEKKAAEESKMRVDAKVKGGKPLDQVKAETTTSRDQAKQQLDEPNGLKGQKKTADEKLKNANTNLKGLNDQRLVAEGDARTDLDKKIQKAQDEVKEAEKTVNSLQKDIEKADTQLKNDEEDLKTITKMESEKPSAAPTAAPSAAPAETPPAAPTSTPTATSSTPESPTPPAEAPAASENLADNPDEIMMRNYGDLLKAALERAMIDPSESKSVIRNSISVEKSADGKGYLIVIDPASLKGKLTPQMDQKLNNALDFSISRGAQKIINAPDEQTLGSLVTKFVNVMNIKA
jgi:hypothetical protein